MAIAAAAERLAAVGVPSPEVDAIALAERALGVPQLILATPPAVPHDFEATFTALVRRREGREPLQHIVGYAAFRRLTVQVRPGVFVPRPETEVVAGAAVSEARRLVAAGREPLVVDLCCGSGVIALSVAHEVPGSRVVAVDVDPAAVCLARANAGRLATRSTPEPNIAAPDRAEPASGRSGHAPIRIELGDVTDPGLLGDLDGVVDIVIGNPPYVPDDAVPLEREVADHDPALALFGGGSDGLDLPRAVVTAATRLLRADGLFVMEHGDVQAAAVRGIVDRTNAFAPAMTHPDLTGRDRYVHTRRHTP